MSPIESEEVPEAPAETAISSETRRAAFETMLEAAEASLLEMEELEDYYFGTDRPQKMQTISDKVLLQTEKVLTAPGLPPRARCRAWFVKGRVTSLVRGQDAVAEQILSKALKLDPTCVRAWNALGEVYWNQHNITQSQECFEQAMEFCGKNAVSLRNLSMTLRAHEDTTEGGNDELTAARRRSDNYAKALDYAKEAVKIDAEDPQNWETLGNALVGDFFVNAKPLDEMTRALKAFAMAEAACEKKGKRNPTLPLNRAKVAMYLEDYDLAISCFLKAADIGASGARDQGQRVLDLVERLATLAERKGDRKVKHVKELTADFPCSSSGSPEGLTLSMILGDKQAYSSGSDVLLPPKAQLLVKVVLIIERRDEVPVILGCCDAAGDFFAVSVYNAEFSKVASVMVPMRSLLRIQSDQCRCRKIAVTATTGKPLAYPCIRVSHPSAITVVGSGSLACATVQSMFSSTAGPISADGSTPTTAATATATATTAATATTTPTSKKNEAKQQRPAGAAARETTKPHTPPPPGQASRRGAKGSGKVSTKAPPQPAASNDAADAEAERQAKLLEEELIAALTDPPPKASRSSASKSKGKKAKLAGTKASPHSNALHQLEVGDLQDRASVVHTLLPALRSAVESEVGKPLKDGSLARIEKMFSAVGDGEIHTEESDEYGKRYAPGFVADLQPNLPYHATQSLSWCQDLRRRWQDIRSELEPSLESDSLWVPGIYTECDAEEDKEWRLSGVLLNGEWQKSRWPKTVEIIQSLQAIVPYEAFFARLPAQTSIEGHSDNLNYILTASLTLKASPRECKLKVGNTEAFFAEGEVLVYDTTYIHSVQNDSAQDRCVLLLRYWHPDLTAEERMAIQFAHTLLSGAAASPCRTAVAAAPSPGHST